MNNNGKRPWQHSAHAPSPLTKTIEKQHERAVATAAAEDWEAYVGTGIAKCVADGNDHYCGKEIPPETRDAYRELLDHAAAVIIGQVAKQTEATYELLGRFDRAYTQLQSRSRSLRFDDITGQLARGLSHATLDRLEYRLDAQICHLLLDEFQDTSPLQWQVLRPYAERVTDHGGQREFFWTGKERSLFCVGDVKQAIYGWRGGSSEIFDSLHRSLRDLQSHELNLSYRSAAPVIDVVNRVFQNLQQHNSLGVVENSVREWCATFPLHETVHRDLPGYVGVRTSRRADEPQDQASTTLADAAQHVAQLSEQHPERSIGVLVRRNVTVARMIYLLRRQGILASEEGGNAIGDSAAVQLVVSLLQLADHPGDTIARFPHRKLSLGHGNRPDRPPR